MSQTTSTLFKIPIPDRCDTPTTSHELQYSSEKVLHTPRQGAPPIPFGRRPNIVSRQPNKNVHVPLAVTAYNIFQSRRPNVHSVIYTTAVVRKYVVSPDWSVNHPSADTTSTTSTATAEIHCSFFYPPVRRLFISRRHVWWRHMSSSQSKNDVEP